MRVRKTDKRAELCQMEQKKKLTNFLALDICSTGFPNTISTLGIRNIWQHVALANEVTIWFGTVHWKISSRELVSKQFSTAYEKVKVVPCILIKILTLVELGFNFKKGILQLRKLKLRNIKSHTNIHQHVWVDFFRSGLTPAWFPSA